MVRLIKKWLDTGEYTQYSLSESGQWETRKYTYDPNKYKYHEQDLVVRSTVLYVELNFHPH